MAFGTVKITMISFKAPKARHFYIVASLPGNKSNQQQRIPVHSDGSMNHAFLVPVDEAAAHDVPLKFKIKKRAFFCFDKDVGEVDVPIGDLLEMGDTGDEIALVLSHRVRSPSGKIKGHLEFSYKFWLAASASPSEMNADETVTGHPPAPAPPAENPPPMPGAALYTQMGLANAAPTYGYPPPAYAHPPARYGHAAPPPHPGRNLMQSVMSRVAGDAIWNWLTDPGSNDGFLADAWF